MREPLSGPFGRATHVASPAQTEHLCNTAKKNMAGSTAGNDTQAGEAGEATYAGTVFFRRLIMNAINIIDNYQWLPQLPLALMCHIRRLFEAL